MIKTPLNLAAIALFATLPTLSSAQSVATSLSVSFGESDGTVSLGAGGLSTDVAAPSSLSFASASGAFAVASSVASQNSTGALAGASDTLGFTPIAGVTSGAQDNTYESSVLFPTSPLAGAPQAGFDLCVDGVLFDLSDQSTSSGGCGGVE